MNHPPKDVMTGRRISGGNFRTASMTGYHSYAAAVGLKAANVQPNFELDSYHQIISQEFIQSSVTCPNKNAP
jgi:hypothetical protein